MFVEIYQKIILKNHKAERDFGGVGLQDGKTEGYPRPYPILEGYGG
jgi:hypothetical protein